ncbi:helix-turn-helix domain-containing protein [Herbaspirillum sp.]|uniref:helix-turn-helix domain-containing protein n=1 Tax=Herbaspirillum sp. TaxID=1890675 RepID=UPI0031DB36E7
MPTARSKPKTRDVPQFSLYGEPSRPDNAEPVHIELIETRSRIHDWHISPHTHAGLFQVLFLMSGHVNALMEDQLWEHDGPVVITIHPSVVHGFDFSEEAVGFVLTVDPHIVFSLGGGDVHSDIFSPLFLRPMAIDLARVPELRERMETVLRLLIAESASPRAGHTLMLEWLARSVMLLLVRLEADHRSAELSGRGEFELFSRFRALVEEHFKEQWQVGVYADKLRVTPSRLNRLCLKLAGQSAFDFAQQRLILEACRKLTYVPSGVSTIAYELGFQDPAYFSRLFKRHMGVTPKQYRRTNVLDEAAAAP